MCRLNVVLEATDRWTIDDVQQDDQVSSVCQLAHADSDRARATPIVWIPQHSILFISLKLTCMLYNNVHVSCVLQLLTRIITQAVLTITSPTTSPLANVTSSSSLSSIQSSPPPPIVATPPSSPPPSSPLHKSGLYARWVAMVMRLAKELCVEDDELRRHHVCELYSSGHDKVAEEVRYFSRIHDKNALSNH